MLSLSPITRTLFHNHFSVDGEHEVPVTPELGSPTAAVLARRRLSPASSSPVQAARRPRPGHSGRYLPAPSATSTAPSRQEPAAGDLPSPLENYSFRLSKYRNRATPSPLLREALVGRKRLSSAIDTSGTGSVVPGAGAEEGCVQSSRAKRPFLISPVPDAVSAKSRNSVNCKVSPVHEDQVVPEDQTQVMVDEDVIRKLPSAPQLGAKPLLLFGGDDSDIFATWEE